MNSSQSSNQESELAKSSVAPKTPYRLAPNDLLLRQEKRESNARSYPRRIPLAIKRAKGIHVHDVDGRVFIDCLAAAGTLALGHNHPVVVEAIQRALLDELPMQTLDLTTPVKDEFVEELFAMLPRSFARQAKIQFCGPTGTDGIEAALKLVKTATGRSSMLAFHGAYHGMSQGSLHLMGNLSPKRAVAPTVGVQFVPFPYDYRCPFGLGGEAGEAAGLHYIRTVLNDPESGVLPPAGIILEAVQGEGGVIPASASWLRGLRELATAASVPLVFDEVQSGFGRTGKYFAFEHAGIEPDVVVFSKAVGGGLPLSVVVYRDSLDVWKPGAHAGTFRGNQLAMAAGTATMRFIQAQRLDLHAERMGARLLGHLRSIQKRSPCVGDARGLGLMLGMEMVDVDSPVDALGRHAGSGALASAVQSAALKRGLIVEVGGRFGATVRLLPPLIITESEIDTVAEILSASIDDAVAAVNAAKVSGS